MTSGASRLSALLEASRIVPLAAVGADPEILGASMDSRQVEPGHVFVAVAGARADGEAFVGEAIQRGARAVVARSPRPETLAGTIGWVQVEQPRLAAALLARECYGRPDEALTLIGVTGTNGKTTVTWLLQSICTAAGRRCGRIGTTGYGFVGRERKLQRTTPEAPELYRLLNEMRGHGVELVALEVSSHALALSRVAGARFLVAAFLNLSRDHLDFHTDEADYFEAKASLFDAVQPSGHCVLPAVSPWTERLRERSGGRRVWAFGREAAADVRLLDERAGLEGSSAVLETASGRLPVRTFLLGRHNLDNIAAAAACALAAGLPAESIPPGVLALETVPGRSERVECGQPFVVLVDYAHTPAALRAMLQGVRDAARGRVLVVFGCGGARDRDKRPEMGRVAVEVADIVILTSDNPRDEDPERVLDEIERGVAAAGGADRTLRIADRAAAIREAVARARPGDAVVIAGKGHETVQVVGTLRHPFDDREVAREALAALGSGGSGIADA